MSIITALAKKCPLLLTEFLSEFFPTTGNSRLSKSFRFCPVLSNQTLESGQYLYSYTPFHNPKASYL